MLVFFSIHLIYYVSGFWAYPILGQLAFPYRLLFIAFCTAVIFGAFLIGDVYNSYLLDNMGKQKKVKKQRRD
jgi:antibiotic biosynthesis monooxygenase (ABM) superfamily enzyme